MIKNVKFYLQKINIKNKNLLLIFLLLVLIIVFLLFINVKVHQESYQNSLQSMDPDDKTYKIIKIENNSSINKIAHELYKAGLIKKDKYFLQYAKNNQFSNGQLKYGVFYLRKSESIPEIYNILKKGPNVQNYRKYFIKTRINYAKKLEKEYHILPSINLAQTILESNWGSSLLASKYNNYYGIKSQKGQKSVTLKTREYINNQTVIKRANFAVYKSWKEGMKAHAEFIFKGTKLNSTQFKDVLAAKNYKMQANALVKDGYATDPNYAGKLISIINAYKLNKYD